MFRVPTPLCGVWTLDSEGETKAQELLGQLSQSNLEANLAGAAVFAPHIFVDRLSEYESPTC
jgi:hypothetical protein